jgi:ABC-type multidrug transport system fused ATPase/permease subunit
MVLADWQVGQVFYTFLWFALFFVWIWLFVMVLTDLFRDHELSNWYKALWVIGIIIFPILGVLIYLIARGGSMAERSAKQVQAAQQDFDSYVRSVAGSGGSAADELERLADLRARGAISEEEFAQLKAKVLASA